MKEIGSKELTDLKVAYALNMCTVSVSQIVQYNDVYVLEQEYDAILNNLNLEEMPADPALLDILTQILNTITFFRIQEIKKKKIEQEYQQQVKDAIWSAIPSMSMIVSTGDPLSLVASMAIQVGTGYMNYRKTKANLIRENRDKSLELEITAIEQFNALRRDLFTTAWKLSDKYGFPDRYRLTENQISQYNRILMDIDEVRKYERLESIQENFEAYLPFWYNIGHTAACIAGVKDDPIQKHYYENRALAHFDYFYKLYKNCRLNLLRVDLLVASYALEYADLLMITPQYGDKNNEMINSLLHMAKKNSGNTNDILQLCAIGYLKMGNFIEASKLFKILVNEGYNVSSNSKILSRLYVLMEIKDPGHTDARVLYDILKSRVNAEYLFPMPDIKSISTDDGALNNEFIFIQRKILNNEYRCALTEYVWKYTVVINKLLFTNHFFDEYQMDDSCFDNSVNAKSIRREAMRHVLNGRKSELYLDFLYGYSLRTKYIDVLNHMFEDLNNLSIFKEKKKVYVGIVRGQLVLDCRSVFERIQTKLSNGSFDINDYDLISNNCSFENISKEMFRLLKNEIVNKIANIYELESLNRAESELFEFCNATGIELTELAKDNYSSDKHTKVEFLDYSILGDSVQSEVDNKKKFERLLECVKKYKDKIDNHSGDVRFLIYGSRDFDIYFDNYILSQEIKAIKGKTLAIVDDTSKKDCDLLLTINGIRKVEKNRLIDREYSYNRVKIEIEGREQRLRLDQWFVYYEPNVNYEELYNLFKSLDDEIKLR